MNTKQMEYIVKIAETRSITKAAQELFITQSALDQQLLKLEKELKTKLFVRSKQHLTLTPPGSVYVSYAKKILALKKEAYAIIGDISQRVSGTLSMGLTPERGIEMFMAVYPEFYKRYPAVSVIPREIRVRSQLEMLRAGDLDIGFMTMSKKELGELSMEYVRILSEHFVIAVPEKYAVAQEAREKRLTKIPLTMLRSLPFAMMFDDSTQRGLVDPLFERAGFKPNLILKTASNYTLLKMVENGLCCSIFPEYYAAPNDKISFFRLDAETSWELVACYRRDKYITNAAHEFIKMASDFWHKRQIEHKKQLLFGAAHTPAPNGAKA